MIAVSPENPCYGCGVCVSACPQRIISMRMGNEGFLLPQIVDVDRCTECGICERVCSWLEEERKNPSGAIVPEGFSVVTRSASILGRATSGGAAFEIARQALSDGFDVCGVRYDCGKLAAEHFVADNPDDYRQAIGSKYLQSRTMPAFTAFSDRKSRFVVFGTPCQIDSLRRYIVLTKRENDFILVDLFCHGVPSYLLWKNYLRQAGVKKMGGVSFRDKKNGWHRYTLKIDTESGIRYASLEKHGLFHNLFLSNLCLNRPCYTCKFRLDRSAADIRLGDMWGRKYGNDEKGVSGVLALTSRGREIVSRLATSCDVRSEKPEDVWEGQMKGALSVPGNRGKVISALQTGRSLRYLYVRYAYAMFFKNLMPCGVKSIIKKIIGK